MEGRFGERLLGSFRDGKLLLVGTLHLTPAPGRIEAGVPRGEREPPPSRIAQQAGAKIKSKGRTGGRKDWRNIVEPRISLCWPANICWAYKQTGTETGEMGRECVAVGQYALVISKENCQICQHLAASESGWIPIISCFFCYSIGLAGSWQLRF